MSHKITMLKNALEGFKEDYEQYLNETYERDARPHRANYNSDIEWPDFVDWTIKNCLTFEQWMIENSDYEDLLKVVIRGVDALGELNTL